MSGLPAGVLLPQPTASPAPAMSPVAACRQCLVVEILMLEPWAELGALEVVPSVWRSQSIGSCVVG